MARLLLFLLLAFGLAVPGSASGAGRVALVIGNDAYKAAPLVNPTYDAHLVAGSLEKAGFDVTVALNVDLEGFDEAITRFADRATGADVALFYFAGHGFSISDSGVPQSYLMSTSAKLESNSDVVLHSGGIPLDYIITTISRAAKVSAFFIDACRNDPRARGGGGRSIESLPTSGDNEVFVALSTRLGTTAADGPPGSSSAFARAFANHIGEPNVRIDDAFTRIRIDVEAESNNTQSPDVLRYDLDRPLVLAELSPGNAVITPTQPEVVPLAPKPKFDPVPPPDLSALYRAAKSEGMLSVIALPRDWCGYGAVIDGFKAKYPGIAVNELDPDAGSSDVIEAIKANKGNTGPEAPDVIDVGLSFGSPAKRDGLIQPYKVSTWSSIPGSAKDEDGYWYGDYYGVLSFLVNTDLVSRVPTSWRDLASPEYANSVALAGDPRASNQAIQGVYGAGLATGATYADAASEAGLAYFANLNRSGNFVPVIGSASSLAQGTTPIVVAWDYNALAWRDVLAGNPPAEVVVPADSVVAGVYIQAISAYAPHPNAAKLWMEYLYSDEGQLGWLAGYCHPVRYNDLVARGVVPQDLRDKLPPADAYARVVFPTLDEMAVAKAEITSAWDTIVGANIQ